MHNSTTPSLSQIIWPRWASRQFLALAIVQTLLPVTFDNSLSSEAVLMRQLRRWERRWRSGVTLTQEYFHGAFQRWLEQYNNCMAAGGDYFEAYWSFMCVLSIKVPIRKKSGKLSYAPRYSCDGLNYAKCLRIFEIDNMLSTWIIQKFPYLILLLLENFNNCCKSPKLRFRFVQTEMAMK